MPTNLIVMLLLQMFRKAQKNGAFPNANRATDTNKPEEAETDSPKYRFPGGPGGMFGNININKPTMLIVSNRAKRIWGILITLIILILLGFIVSASLVPDILWYSQLGFTNVLVVKYLAPMLVFFVGFVAAVLVTMISLTLVFKTRATYQIASIKASQIDDLKAGISKYKTRWFLGISAVIGIFFGLSVAAGTTNILLLFQSVPFGQTDPIFGNDISFYVFTLTGLGTILGALIWLFIIMLVIGFLAGSVFGQATIATTTLKFGKMNMIRLAKPLRFQLSIYAAILSLLLAIQTFFGRYDLLTKVGDRITGATWTDANVRIPVTTILAACFVVAALLFIFAGIAGNIKPPLIALGTMAVIAIVAGVVLPVAMQNLKVAPNAQAVESEYIAKNIEATKNAYQLNNVDIVPYNATTETAKGALKNDAETTAQIRLMDPQIVAPTFRQLQQNKQYYGFTDTLSVDKYTFGGKPGEQSEGQTGEQSEGQTGGQTGGQSHDTVIAARELNLAGSDQRNWVNDHTVFTHGFGVVSAYGNEVTADGRPKFFESDIPTQGELTKRDSYEPRIYFSQNAPDYSIVGAPEGQNTEFDYPEAPTNTTFKGDGGPSISNPFVKFLYAIKFKAYQIFFSDNVNSESQILYDRDPSDRVQKVAPYLTLDGRVYPAVVDARVKWIIDAYTTTDKYPYSSMVDLSSVTKDTLTETTSSITALDAKNANYIRNSVKATVDAYDGSVNLYAWDPEDPVLKAWSAIYGTTLHPISEISGDLMSHIRYPENFFKVQRSLLGKYHVTDPNSFFSGSDFWKTPADPTSQGGIVTKTGQHESGVTQPPYYLTLQVPGKEEPTFSLTSSFIPGGNSTREILTGFLSADSDAGNEPGVIGPNYGKLHLLELPKNTTVPGPGQAQNNFDANADVSKELNLLGQGSTKVQRGNLLTLPLGGGLVYVQPVYVQSSGNTTFPLLKKVLVAFGDKVGFANTLDEALDQVFNGDSGAYAGDADIAGKESGVIDTGSGDTSSSPGATDGSGSSSNADGSQDGAGGTTTPSGADAQSIDDAKKAIDDAKAALDKAYKALQDAQ